MEAASRLALAALLLSPTLAHAQDGEAEPVEAVEADGGERLRRYYDALAERRLLAAETGSVEQLRDLVRRGEELYLDGRFEEAERVLSEAVESPRYRDFAGLDDYRSAQLMLAGSLRALGARRSAQRHLDGVLEAGAQDPLFGPAYRRAVDIALESADVAAAIEHLTDVVPEDVLPPDAQNELLYLRGRARYAVRDWAGAADFLEQVGRRSRFYANARYLQGAIAARAGDLDEAEDHFCSIATTPDTDRFTFYVDQRYFEIRDLTWLALGRIAHEGRRADDAFYYYFQVPQDSLRVTEALFEAAWSMYEGDDHDAAIDLLDQLEARFGDSPFVHEAALLRGYIHLARCEFEEADRLFRAFQDRFTPVVEEIDRILENPARQRRLVEELLAAEATQPTEPSAEGEATTPTDVRAIVLSLLRVDPVFYRLYRDVTTLDAEAARSGRLGDELGAIRARLTGVDAPAPAVAAFDEYDPEGDLADDLEQARAVLRALSEQLDEMRSAGATAAQLGPIEADLARLGTRVEQLGDRLGAFRAASRRAPPRETLEDPVMTILAEDRAAAARFPARVAEMRSRLLDAANGVALRAVAGLRGDLGGYLRRSRIGRIDAVMGSKRRIEIQIESLAAGRFPAELQDPLAIQGLLRDDEEYWPFEGEYWADEFQEAAADGDEDFADDDEDFADDDLDADAEADEP